MSDRAMAINVLKVQKAVHEELDNRGEVEALDMAIKALEEPQRKKGKWIHDGYDFPHGNDWIHCSECGKRGINVPADLTNFCPNCGADMRKDGATNADVES